MPRQPAGARHRTASRESATRRMASAPPALPVARNPLLDHAQQPLLSVMSFTLEGLASMTEVFRRATAGFSVSCTQGVEVVLGLDQLSGRRLNRLVGSICVAFQQLQSSSPARDWMIIYDERGLLEGAPINPAVSQLLSGHWSEGPATWHGTVLFLPVGVLP